MQTAHFRRELLESVYPFANLQMRKLCKATYTDYSRICRLWIYSELSDMTQGCLGNLTTTREELPPGGWVSPGKHSLTHTLSSLTGTMPSNWQEVRFLLLSTAKTVLCKFLWNFDDVSSCIDFLKMKWWKSLVVVRVCLAKGSCGGLSIAVTSLSLFQPLFIRSRDFMMPINSSDSGVAMA